MSFNPPTEIAPGTIAQYEMVYARFERWVRAEEKLPATEAVNPVMVARYFDEHEGDWEVATARWYKAALMHGFNQRALSDPAAISAIDVMKHTFDDEEKKLKRKDELRQSRQAARRARPRTARQKVKRFSKEDARELVTALVKMRSEFGELAGIWFIAGSLTGLRPIEWKQARIDFDHMMRRVLVVKNAKHTNGRAHSMERTIILADLTDEQNRAITRQIENVRGFNEAGDFERLYRECRRCVQRIADKLWPYRTKHPTLYTARHMFSADVKVIFDKIEVAALMGHASTKTAGTHYARRWSGNGGLGVKPSEHDVQVVQFLNPSEVPVDNVPQTPAVEWPASALNGGNN